MGLDYNQELAQQFMRNIVAVKPGENTWIEYCSPKAKILAEACAAEVEALWGIPHMVDSTSEAINREIMPMAPAELKAYGEDQLAQMMQMRTYIRIKDDADEANITLPISQRKAYNEAMRPQIDYRVNNTRWLVVAAPTEEFAADCKMSFPEFREFYRNVCLTDYGKMTEAVKPLQKIMADGKKVRIYSPEQGTDLSFSIEGIDAIPCTGKHNIPDGECFTAPVRDSINGTIKFGPSNYDGEAFKSITLHFENGRIESAEAETLERTKALNDILDADGARYVGEFAINFNPYIQHPTGSILFDEKIDGGIHMAMGNAYDDAFNGNKSTVHWDMVHIQRPDYGGGQIWIDDVLIRENGLFILPELLALNPENFMGALAQSPKEALVQAAGLRDAKAAVSVPSSR